MAISAGSKPGLGLQVEADNGERPVSSGYDGPVVADNQPVGVARPDAGSSAKAARPDTPHHVRFMG